MLTTNLNPNVTKTALDAVFFQEFDYPNNPGEATAEDALVFMQDTIDRAAVITEQYKGPGYFTERAEEEDVSSATPRSANQKTSNVINFARSVDISKNFFDDDQHQFVSRMIKDFGRVARVTRDRASFQVWNDSFTTQLSNDGVALFSNSHTTIGGQTVDNLETGALSETNLETSFNSLINQLTQDGTLGGHTPACLLVPTALFKEAMEITKSELRQGTTDNDMNYFSQVYPGLQVKFSPFLAATQGGSDTAWFLLSRNHSLMRWVRQGVQTSLIDWQFQRNNNYIYKAEYREVVDSISFEGLVGSNGTT